MRLFPERNGNAARKMSSRVSEKNIDQIHRFLYPFLLAHDYLFDDPISLEYICKGFQVFLLYIRGKSYGTSIFNESILT